MKWRLGYVPLTDAAVLIAAVERGFTREAGLDVELTAKPSWAALRDEIALGHLDGGHMLAPLAVAASLGLSGPRTPLATVCALSLNGNAITVSRALWAEMVREGADGGLTTTAHAFVGAGRARAKAGRPLALGTVFPFSCHTYQLQRFAALGGGELAAFSELLVVPPPRTADALDAGTIDGFCVGAPWNSVAVAAGTGVIAALGSAIAPGTLEKVLVVQRHLLGQGAPLAKALGRAARWCADERNRDDLATLIAGLDVRGVDAALVHRILEGRLLMNGNGTESFDPRYVAFPSDLTVIPSQCDALAREMIAAGHLPPRSEDLVSDILRPRPESAAA